MGELWVSFGKMAEAKGCSVTAARNAASRGDFGGALSTDGRRVNPAHPDAEKWLGKKYVPAKGKVGRRRKSAAEQAAEALDPIEEQPKINDVADEDEIQRVADAIILLTEMGTPSQIQKWARVRKEVAAAAAAEAKRDQATGQLIPRALVERAVFGLLDAMCGRALEDIATTIAQQVGDGSAEHRRKVEDLMGSLIETSRERCKKLLLDSE